MRFLHNLNNQYLFSSLLMSKINNKVTLFPFFLIFFTVFFLKKGSMSIYPEWVIAIFPLIVLSTILSYVKYKRSLNFNFLDLFVLVFYAIGIVNSLFREYVNFYRLEHFTLVIILYFCFRIIINQKIENLSFISIFYIVSIFTYCLYGIFEYYGVIFFSAPQQMTGRFSNFGLYSGYLVTSLPLVVFYIFKYKYVLYTHRSIHRVFFFVFLVVTFILLFFVLYHVTKRATILSIIISISILLAGLYQRKVFVFIADHKRFSFVLGLVLFILLFVFSFKLYNQSLGSSTIRYKVGLVTLKAIENNKMGVGLGCFSKAYNPQHILYNKEKSGTDILNFVAPYPYNEFLNIGVEFGILGLICFVLIVFLAFYYAIKKKLYGHLAALLSLQVFSLMWYPYLFLSFIICLVFLLASVSGYSKVQGSLLLSNSLTVVISLLCLICTISGINRLLAEKKFRKMKENPISISVEHYADNFAALQSDETFLFSYSSYLNNKEKYDEALNILERLQVISSKKTTYLAIAKVYIALGEIAKAEEYLENYYYMEPYDIRAKYNLSDIYLDLGNVDKAEYFISEINKKDSMSYSAIYLNDKLEKLKKWSE